jgi:hypothetical protein
MDFESLKKSIVGLYDSLHASQTEYLHLWRSYILLTWRWWVGVALVVLPWTLWIIVRKKGSTCRLLFAGLFVLIISSILDMLGIVLNLWSYPSTTFPLMPCYVEFDFCSLPVTTMLFIQFFPKIKPVYKAIVYATAGSLIFQPLMEYIGLYCQEQWADYYSIPILFGIYMIADFIATRKSFAKIR